MAFLRTKQAKCHRERLNNTMYSNYLHSAAKGPEKATDTIPTHCQVRPWGNCRAWAIRRSIAGWE